MCWSQWLFGLSSPGEHARPGNSLLTTRAIDPDRLTERPSPFTMGAATSSHEAAVAPPKSVVFAPDLRSYPEDVPSISMQAAASSHNVPREDHVMQEADDTPSELASGRAEVLDEGHHIAAYVPKEPAAKPQTFIEVMRAMQRPLGQVPAGSRIDHEAPRIKQPRVELMMHAPPAPPTPADSMPPDLPSGLARVPNGVLARAQWAQANRDKLLREHREKEARARTLQQRSDALCERVHGRREHMVGRYQAAVADCKAGKTTESQRMRSHLATNIVTRRSTDMEHARQNAEAVKTATTGKVAAARKDVREKTRQAREATAVQQQFALDEKARRLAALKVQTASKHAAKYGYVPDDTWGDSAFAQYSPLAQSTTRMMRRSSHDTEMMRCTSSPSSSSSLDRTTHPATSPHILQSPSPQLAPASVATWSESLSLGAQASPTIARVPRLDRG